jgi:hypothetical protein
MKTSKSVTSNYNLLSSSTLLPSNSNFNNKLPTHIILKILCFLYNNPYIGYELNGIRRIPLNPNGDLYNTLFVCKTWYTVAKRILWIKPRFPSIKSYNRFVRILKELTEEKLNKDKAMLSITSPIKASFITNENRKESQHEIKVDDENNSIHNTLEVNNSIKKEKESNELEKSNTNKRENDGDESSNLHISKKTKLEKEENNNLFEYMEIDTNNNDKKNNKNNDKNNNNTSSIKNDDTTTASTKNMTKGPGAIVEYLYIGDDRFEIRGSEDTIDVTIPIEPNDIKAYKDQKEIKFKYGKFQKNARETHTSIKSKITNEHVITIAGYCPNIKHINLIQCERITDEAIEVLISKCPKIEQISIGGCNITDKTIINLTKLTNLTGINIQRCNVSESALQILVRCCPKLESLNLSECYDVSDILISDICNYCPEIRYLGLSKCYKITESSLYEIKNKLKKNKKI